MFLLTRAAALIILQNHGQPFTSPSISSINICTLRLSLKLCSRGRGNNALEALDSRITASAEELDLNVFLAPFLLVIVAVAYAVTTSTGRARASPLAEARPLAEAPPLADARLPVEARLMTGAPPLADALPAAEAPG